MDFIEFVFESIRKFQENTGRTPTELYADRFAMSEIIRSAHTVMIPTGHPEARLSPTGLKLVGLDIKEMPYNNKLIQGSRITMEAYQHGLLHSIFRDPNMVQEILNHAQHEPLTHSFSVITEIPLLDGPSIMLSDGRGTYGQFLIESRNLGLREPRIPDNFHVSISMSELK